MGRRESVASLTRISGIIGVIDGTVVRSVTGVVTLISHFTGPAGVPRVTHVTRVPGLSRIAGLAGISGTGRLMPVGRGRVAGASPAAHVASVPRQRGTNT